MTGLKVEEVNVHVQGVNTDTAKNDTPNESEKQYRRIKKKKRKKMK